MKIPGHDHSITITPNPGRVVVTFDGRAVADTSRALTMQEAGHAPVHYIPRADVDTSMLERTTHSTYCPYKGDAAYFSLRGPTRKAENAVWTYERPYDAVATIEDHLAFYPNLVDAIDVEPARPRRTAARKDSQ